MTASIAADPMQPAFWTVRQVAKETHDTFTLALESPDGASGAFQPGQFSMLWMFGVGEVPISISGDPAHAERLVYTVRSVGHTTHALVSRSPGDPVGVRGPFGTAWPIQEAKGKDVVVVAGGIGLAPLRGVICHVLNHRHEYGRLIILYGARSARDVLYRKELAIWARQPDTVVQSTVDYGGPTWRGRVGVVTTLFKQLRLQPGQAVAMVCGPEIMMRFAARDLLARGVAPSDLYVSMERNMKCAVGFCGHCQWGPHFICRDGPIFPYARIGSLVDRHEL